MPSKTTPHASPTLHTGTSGYAYKEWKGSFYPDDLPAKKFLNYYSQHFNAVEINASFYKLPTPTTLADWCAQLATSSHDSSPSSPSTKPPRRSTTTPPSKTASTPRSQDATMPSPPTMPLRHSATLPLPSPTFLFTLKAPQRITHFQRLKNAEDSLAEFVAAARLLGPHRGPILFGLPPNFKKDTPRLRDFLALIPTDIRAAIEFRHASWFDDETLTLLRAHNTALCIADTDPEDGDDSPLKVPFEPTADFGYLRLRRANYTPAQLKSWLKRIESPTNNWRNAFIFFKHEDTGTAPKFAAKLNALADTRKSV